MKILNLVGQKFGRLLVKNFSHSRGGKRVWSCICDCGNQTEKITSELTGKKISSCGCLRSEATSQRKRTHGYTRTPTYVSWSSMKRRCNNPKHVHFYRYGGAGVKVCDRWQNSFEAFLEDMGERPIGKTLDRIDNSLGYFKENCRWATRSEQNANQHHPKKPGRGKKISFNGLEHTIKEWSEILEIPVPTLTKRLKKEPTIERAFEKRRLSANQWFRS